MAERFRLWIGKSQIQFERMTEQGALSLAHRQRRSGVRRTAIPRPGVTSAREEVYSDAEARVRHVALRSGGHRDCGVSSVSRFYVFGEGSGRAGDVVVKPGNLLVVPPSAQAVIDTTDVGLDFFEVEVEGAPTEGHEVRVEHRVPLSPFHEEQILVPEGTPFQFGKVFNLAEVLVPPGVTTSQHDLGVNERYLMLGGRGTMFLDGHSFPAGHGDVVHIPTGVLQNIRNDSSQPLRFYCLCTPPFSAETYGPGPVRGSGPPDFDIDTWWKTHGSDYT